MSFEPSRKVNGLRRSLSRKKSTRNTMTRVRISDRFNGEIISQSKLMRAGTGWGIFRRALKKNDRERVVIELITRYGDDVASSTDEDPYWD